jgi:hypothetical protein
MSANSCVRQRKSATNYHTLVSWLRDDLQVDRLGHGRVGVEMTARDGLNFLEY